MMRNEKTSKHAGNRDRAGHDHAEGRIEHEFPNERSRSRQSAAQQPVQQPDRGVKWNNDGNLVESAGENISGQDLLEMFGALRRPVDEQNGRRRRNNVDDADQRLLRHAGAPCAREGQQHRRKQRERERIAIGRNALRRMTEHECDRRAERRDLRERQIDKDHFAGKHLDAEIGVDADKRDRHQERRPEKNERLDHRLAAADVRASTFASNSEM